MPHPLYDFKIGLARNDEMGCWDVMLQVGGLRDEAEAKAFADVLAEWMKGESGWIQRVQ